MAVIKKGKTRNSSFELMRISSMFLIVVYHIIYHGELLAKVSGLLEIILRLLIALTLVHVSSFIVLSGYFQRNKKMKLSKAISLNNAVWFYTIAIAIIAHYLYNINFNKVTIFKILMPINYDQYWFIKEYLILYLITPILNIVIKNSNQKQLKKILVALFLITSLLPYITAGAFLSVNSGYSLYYMIFLYFVGAYLSKYPIQKSNILKKWSHSRYSHLFIMLYLIFSLLNFLLYKFGAHLLNRGELLSYFGEIITNSFLYYNNPLVLFATISYFLVFANFKIESKLINKVASLMFGVYLIHDNNYLRIPILQLIGLNVSNFNYKIIPKIFIATLIILTICAIIEYLRQIVFKIIYNLKISKNNRKNYRSHLNKIGLEINW